MTGPLSGYTVSGANTVTGIYVAQWKITFAQIGIGVDTGANTVATIGRAHGAGDLPVDAWYDDGSQVTYGYESFVETSPASTKRYRQTSVTGIASGASVTTSSTITGNYVVQWLLTFAQSGIAGDTGTNAVVT